jgi:hypothetical protein
VAHEQSAGSLKYLYWDVSAVIDGVPAVLSAMVVKIAFTASKDTPPAPDGSTAIVGSWVTVGSGASLRYRARCLVGPGGAATLIAGTYAEWLRIVSSPEIPFDYVGQLTITP